MDQTKLYQVDLDSPRRDLSNGGLGFLVALLVYSGINFLCVCSGGPIQPHALYIYICICIYIYIYIIKGAWGGSVVGRRRR